MPSEVRGGGGRAQGEGWRVWEGGGAAFRHEGVVVVVQRVVPVATVLYMDGFFELIWGKKIIDVLCLVELRIDLLRFLP